MIEVRLSASFRSWLTALEDRKARNRVTARITRAEAGLLGDVKPIGGR
jgi:putative addiction module killer protein